MADTRGRISSQFCANTDDNDDGDGARRGNINTLFEIISYEGKARGVEKDWTGKPCVVSGRYISTVLILYKYVHLKYLEIEFLPSWFISAYTPPSIT